MSIICAPAGVIGSASPSANLSLIGIITDLGLTTNLKLCLDAGDADSYNPAVQTAKWLDTSGNGYDFYRGTSTGGDGAEPTFNGSAGGLSSSEYWSFDGGDYFTYDTTNEAWMNNLHKDSAIYSFLYAFYPANFSTIWPIWCTGSTIAQPGVNHQSNALGQIRHRVQTDSGTSALTAVSSAAFTSAAWNIGGGAVDEGSGTGIHLINAATESYTSIYTTPGTNNPPDPMAVGAYTNLPGANKLPSDSRIACLAVWEGTALTEANLTALYDAIKVRFGL